MFRCPVCNSADYYVSFGYGSYCEDCDFARDGEGQVIGGDEDE